MHTDAWGLPVTTSSVRALEHYDSGIRGLLGWEACALDEFRAAAREDPSLALAHAGVAVCLFLEEQFAEARAAAEAARAAVSGATSRERGHVEAMALLVAGKPPDAERAMREHLAAFPRDLAVLQRLYFIWFWQGRFPEMLDFTTAIAKHYVDAPFFHGLHAFALSRRTGATRRCARRRRRSSATRAMRGACTRWRMASTSRRCSTPGSRVFLLPPIGVPG